MRIYNEEFTKETNLIKKDETIVSLSDIHINTGCSYKLLDKAIESVEMEKPNYITISGDVMNRASHYLIIENRKKLMYLLKRLSNIAQVFLSLGNHDLSDSKTITSDEIKDLLRYLEHVYNFILLDNKSFQTDNINFIGFSQRLDGYREYNRKHWNDWFIEDLVKSDLKAIKDKFNCLLLHSPMPLLINNKELLNEINDLIGSIDLIICGHLHDGIIPKSIQKFNPNSNKGLQPIIYRPVVKECRGAYQNNDTTLVINRGLRKWVLDNPLFNAVDSISAKDIMTIKLKKKD